MHTAELLDEAVALAMQLGYRVRQEWLDGGGGLCVVRGERWLFLDLSQPLAEQLTCVAKVLSGDSRIKDVQKSPSLAEILRAEEKMLMPANVR